MITDLPRVYRKPYHQNVPMGTAMNSGLRIFL